MPSVNRWAFNLATGFGSGYSPVAPGTAGSLVGVLIYLALFRFIPLPVGLILMGGLFLAAVHACGVAETVSRERDPGIIVIDEIYAMILILMMMPRAGYLLPALIVFRVLDVVKPFPARWVENRLGGGWAVMMDDLVAAAYTLVILYGADLMLMRGAP